MYKLTARQEKVIGIQQLEAEQREYAFHGEGAPVHKITVEQIGILLRGQAINLEDVHQIVELTVDVAADCELLLIRHSDVHQRGLSPHVRINLAEYLKGRQGLYQALLRLRAINLLCRQTFGAVASVPCNAPSSPS